MSAGTSEGEVPASATELVTSTLVQPVASPSETVATATEPVASIVPPPVGGSNDTAAASTSLSTSTALPSASGTSEAASTTSVQAFTGGAGRVQLHDAVVGGMVGAIALLISF